jgi:uroporphyrinogen-III decarboxylase
LVESFFFFLVHFEVMNALERILKAFDHEEADRVPTFVQSMMPNFVKAAEERFEDSIDDDDILFIGKDFTLYTKIGLDSGWGAGVGANYADPKIFNDYPMPDLGPGKHIDRTGRITEHGMLNGHGQSWVAGSILTSPEHAYEWWTRYIKPDYIQIPDAVKQANSQLDAAGSALWERFVPVAGVHGLIEPLMEGLGIKLFARMLRSGKYRPWLHEMMSWQTKHAVEHAKICAETKFPIFALADDSAYKNSPMLNPKDHDDLVIPYYTQIVNVLRKAGKLVFFHSDGFTEPYFPGLIRAGFNGVESLEPMAGMDLKHLKDTYGDKLCLIGNIDTWMGTPEDIAAKVKQRIADAAAGGGYIVSPCTDFTDDVPLDNAIAMVDATKKYGVYRK